MLAKDKVCGSLDVRFCVELSAGLSENGVLKTEEFAGVVALVLFGMMLVWMCEQGVRVFFVQQLRHSEQELVRRFHKCLRD